MWQINPKSLGARFGAWNAGDYNAPWTCGKLTTPESLNFRHLA